MPRLSISDLLKYKFGTNFGLIAVSSVSYAPTGGISFFKGFLDNVYTKYFDK